MREIMSASSASDEINSPSVTLPAPPTAGSVPALAESLFDTHTWPKRFQDSATGENLDEYLSCIRSKEAFYDSLGIPCVRATSDEQPRLQPRQWPSLQATKLDSLPDELGVEYIALTRPVDPDQLDQADAHKRVGDSIQGIKVIIVAKEKLAALEAEGWEV